jgi:hypothetical protein
VLDGRNVKEREKLLENSSKKSETVECSELQKMLAQEIFLRK